MIPLTKLLQKSGSFCSDNKAAHELPNHAPLDHDYEHEYEEALLQTERLERPIDMFEMNVE
jgi:hypothetical protein